MFDARPTFVTQKEDFQSLSESMKLANNPMDKGKSQVVASLHEKVNLDVRAQKQRKGKK